MSRNIEFRSNPMLPTEIFGSRRVANHHAVKYRGKNSMTFNGLYETRQEANKGRINYAFKSTKGSVPPVDTVDDVIPFVVLSPFIALEAVGDFVKKAVTTETTELQEGQKYMPWGTGGTIFMHGVDDGTHGSVLKYKDCGHMLKPESY